jgi:hypothetical protein
MNCLMEPAELVLPSCAEPFPGYAPDANILKPSPSYVFRWLQKTVYQFSLAFIRFTPEPVKIATVAKRLNTRRSDR